MFKKMTCLLLSLMLLFTMAPAAFAAEETTDYEIEQYLSLNAEGFIVLDADAAAEGGVPQSYISFIQGNIVEMNLLLEGGNAYVDESFAVTFYLSKTRASGENKVVTYVHGLTEIYMDSTVTDGVIEKMEEISDGLSGLKMATYLTQLAGVPFSAETRKVITALQVVNWVNKQGLVSAAAAGTGTIMSILNDGTTATPIYWFSQQ